MDLSAYLNVSIFVLTINANKMQIEIEYNRTSDDTGTWGSISCAAD